MKRSLVVAALTLAALGSSALPAVALEESFTSAAGDWTFEYPEGWFVNEAREEAWSLTNFRVGPQCCDLDDGEVKIDFSIEPAGDQTLADLRRLECSSSRRRVRDPVECRTPTIGGIEWLRVVFDDTTTGGKIVLAQAIHGDRLYTAEATIPAGSSESDSVGTTKDIIATFRLRQAGIARTGVPAAATVALAVLFLLAGAGMRLGARRVRA